MRLPDWWDAQEPHWQRTAVVLSVILTGVSIVVAVALTSGSSGETGHRLATTPTVPVSTAPPSVSPSTASVTTPAVSPSPDASDSPTPIAVPSPDSDYLFDLTPIDGSYGVGSKPVNGQTYPRSVFHGLSECNPGDGKGYSIEYNLGRQYSTFVATAGLSDIDTRGTRVVQFRIDTDLKHDYFALGRGEARQVVFDIKGALYLRLNVYEKNGSGLCVVDTVAVWGDARIRR